MNKAVICAYSRSPFTPAYKGALAEVRPDDLLAQTIKGMLSKINVNHNDIDDLIVGCAFPEGEQGLNLARIVVFLAGLPISVGGVTVNRFCGSSMQAIHMAAGNIATGSGEVFICAGVESMSRIPMTGFNPMPNPELYEEKPEVYESMGITAENIAKRYKITRKDQEELAVESHKKASTFDKNTMDEIIPISYKGKIIDKDGCIRAETTMEGLKELKPAFDLNGTVTAATSSPLTDGASAVLVCSEGYARKHNLEIIARIKSYAVAGCPPEIMGIGPIEATKKAIKRAGIELSEIDIIELNEAFASQAIACIQDLKLDRKKINIEGGAIALGHPLGATGARITGKAAMLLKKHGAKYALSTQCIGGGQGIATILERV